MASRRPNNVKRTEWNKKCREKLSAHIYRRLGIMIETSQVRLKTNADDPYTWEKLDEKEHLFSKNLSDLSIGQLKDLYDGVDKSFTAIWKAPFQSELSVQDGEESFLELPRPEVSFVAKIDDLHQDNVRLSREISKWERRVATESEGRREAGLKASELKVTIQQPQMDNEKLEKHRPFDSPKHPQRSLAVRIHAWRFSCPAPHPSSMQCTAAHRRPGPRPLVGPFMSPGVSPGISSAGRTSFFSPPATTAPSSNLTKPNATPRAPSGSRSSISDDRNPGSDCGSTCNDRSGGGVDSPPRTSVNNNNFTPAMTTQNRLHPLRLVQVQENPESKGKEDDAAAGG